jgi:DNA-directed RNA polymerase subunit RPC12/RpoP
VGEPSSVEWDCHHCGRTLRGSASLRGELRRCPACGSEIRVPAIGWWTRIWQARFPALDQQPAHIWVPLAVFTMAGLGGIVLALSNILGLHPSSWPWWQQAAALIASIGALALLGPLVRRKPWAMRLAAVLLGAVLAPLLAGAAWQGFTVLGVWGGLSRALLYLVFVLWAAVGLWRHAGDTRPPPEPPAG